jgi:hypothetical protein
MVKSFVVEKAIDGVNRYSSTLGVIGVGVCHAATDAVTRDLSAVQI